VPDMQVQALDYYRARLEKVVQAG